MIKKRTCDCGRPATHKTGSGWECKRCKVLNFQAGEMLEAWIWSQRSEQDSDTRLLNKRRHKRYDDAHKEERRAKDRARYAEKRRKAIA